MECISVKAGRKETDLTEKKIQKMNKTFTKKISYTNEDLLQ